MSDVVIYEDGNVTLELSIDDKTIWLDANDIATIFDVNGSPRDNSTSNVELGDVDGDGDLDAFVANHNQDNKVWINDGNGNFTDSGQSLGTSASTGTEFPSEAKGSLMGNLCQ